MVINVMKLDFLKISVLLISWSIRNTFCFEIHEKFETERVSDHETALLGDSFFCQSSWLWLVLIGFHPANLVPHIFSLSPPLPDLFY